MKTCSKCRKTYSLCDFKHNTLAGVTCRMCSKCRSREKIKNQNRNQEKQRIWNRKNYQRNKETILAKNKAWSGRKGERRAEYLSNWRRENKDKVREYHHRRRAREVGGDLTSSQIKELFEQHPYCEYCKVTHSLCLEHVVPLSRGGQNTLSNVTVACVQCNSSKHNKLLNEWRR